jgi:hypothetical protein
MKVLFLLVILTSCTTNFRQKKINCIKEFVQDDVDALKAVDVCEWVFQKR